MGMNRFWISSLITCATALVASASTYELDLSRGAFPGGVETANLNGVLPDISGYKHGFVKTGWTVDRIETRGYVALSPTYTGTDSGCENLLSLPELEIGDGYILCWEARSVYRHFPESYRVMAYPADGGEPVLLAEVNPEDYNWKKRKLSLSAFAGKKVKIGFLCTSQGGYMLALTGIRVAEDVAPTTELQSSDAPDHSDPDFVRALVVDKGTGMWCVNCPSREVVIDDLEDRFGSRLIMLVTHVRDILDNPGYWEALEYNSVPRMMLNRIKASQGGGDANFEEYYDQPTSFGIRIDGPVEIAERNLKVKARVKVSESIDNSGERYRVGYVITGNFYKPGDNKYIQENNCTNPFFGAYYYLPGKIPSALMHYENVTLTSETAFTGIEGSLPASLVPGESYEVSWECVTPTLLDSPEDARVVAFVIDTVTGELMNACALDASTESVVNEAAVISTESLFHITSDGMIQASILPGEEYCLEVFDVAGIRIDLKTGLGTGCDLFEIPDMTGLMIVTLSTPRGNKAIKFIR